VCDLSIVDRHGCRSAGERHHQVAVSAHREPSEGDLQRSGRVVLSQQPGTEPECAAIGRSRPADPERGEPGTAEVLDQGQRTGLEDLQRPAHGSSSTKRTVVPGRSRAGGSRSRSQITASVCPSSCQPPGEERGSRSGPS
jgi:hypothetical protein